MKIKLFLGIATAIVIVCSFISCSSEDYNLELIKDIETTSETSTLNAKTLDFKTSLISTINNQSQVTRSGEELSFTSEQISELREKSIAMFRSHGFKRSEFKEFLDDGDERIILMAAMFTAIVEQEPVYTISSIKTRTEVGEDDDTCWDLEKLSQCAISAIGVDTIIETVIGGVAGTIKFSAADITALFKGCMTKAGALTTIKTFMKNAGLVGIATMGLSFTNCMGWTDILSDYF